ncbi:MAG: cbb3-type cytochrome c oxidase subunit I [Candidatus Competibacteraceae bacterium]|nr:cbb3-type cytochrome c oxidase subunit I [Candidatus Competibacteraceae bacterium]
MALSNNNSKPVSHYFLFFALILLACGVTYGTIGGLQYLIPGYLKETLSFEKTRPLHVSSVVFWIIIAAVGSMLSYLPQHTGKKIYSSMLARIQLMLMIGAALAITIGYYAGIFGGREYWEFPPLFSLPIIIGWLLLIYNYISSIGNLFKQPVYVWMWLTGVLFFLFTYLESLLWVIPYFRSHVINDMTIQWKSYGSMVGSWNMLIYGCGIFLMDKISGEKKYSYSSIAFLLYFIGLFNLMFNWGHHIYTLPTHAYVKHISYIVSMTELLLLGRIIYKWKDSVSTARKYFYYLPFRFMVAADIWIFLTLSLALAMSVPAINVFTHGTHITVAHTMGATIGINTFMLLAFVFDILGEKSYYVKQNRKSIMIGFWSANISLFIFWISLIGAGITKAIWQMKSNQEIFGEMMKNLWPYFLSFVIAGFVLATAFWIMIVPLFRKNPQSANDK